MLIREQPATDLCVATRILARAGALAPDGRITVRLAEVVYVAGRGVANSTVTPYDVAAVRVGDGAVLSGTPPVDLDRYLAAHRRGTDIGSVALAASGELVEAESVRACAVATLRRARAEPAAARDRSPIEETWLELVRQARVAGALIGAFPVGREGP